MSKQPKEHEWSIWIDGTSFDGSGQPNEAKEAVRKFLTTLLRQGHAITCQFHDYGGDMDTVEDIEPR